MIATEDSSHVKNGIKVQMEIGRINAEGQRIVTARPTMITTSGETVTVTSGKSDDKIHIEITPLRN